MSTPPEGESKPPMMGELAISTVMGVCSLIALTLGAVVVLTVLGKPVNDVLTFVGVIIAPTVGTLLAARKLDKTNNVLKDVHVKVNGRLDALLNDKAALENQLRETGVQPVTAPLPPVPRPTSDEYSASAIIERINHDGR